MRIQSIICGLSILFYVTTIHAASYSVDDPHAIPMRYNLMTANELDTYDPKIRCAEEARKASMVCEAATRWSNEYKSAIIDNAQKIRSNMLDLYKSDLNELDAHINDMKWDLISIELYIDCKKHIAHIIQHAHLGITIVSEDTWYPYNYNLYVPCKPKKMSTEDITFGKLKWGSDYEVFEFSELEYNEYHKIRNSGSTDDSTVFEIFKKRKAPGTNNEIEIKEKEACVLNAKLEALKIKKDETIKRMNAKIGELQDTQAALYRRKWPENVSQISTLNQFFGQYLGVLNKYVYENPHAPFIPMLESAMAFYFQGYHEEESKSYHHKNIISCINDINTFLPTLDMYTSSWLSSILGPILHPRILTVPITATPTTLAMGISALLEASAIIAGHTPPKQYNRQNDKRHIQQCNTVSPNSSPENASKVRGKQNQRPNLNQRRVAF